MGKVMIKLMTKIVGVVFIFLLIYLISRASSSYRHGYSWREMDWNQDGTTSIAEVIYGSDIGKREVIRNQKACVEYYAYKDGLPIKTVCPQ
ncbi:hypothetical protein EVC37_16960 [Methylocaldum sp. BRCS4]|jgi:hypothetical protein|nr:hypothetical protein [Methylocaldum sp. BRCS4]